jgi:hypothetical protein
MMWIALLLVIDSGPPALDPVPEFPIVPSRQQPDPPFRWQLQYDELDQVPGNAAPYWVRAGMVIRRINQRWEQVDFTKIGPRMPEKDRVVLGEIVKKHADAYRHAEQASLRVRCEWEHPPLTIQSLADPLGLPFEELQTAREVANLLRLRAKLSLLESDFDAAARDLRIGLTLARHLRAEQRFVLADLVSIAISTVMLGVVEDWAALPDSPNLYWALTALPEPLIDVRPTIRHELNTVYRSSPMLRELKTRTINETEARTAWRQLFFAIMPETEKEPMSAMKELEQTASMALLQAKMLPRAQKELQSLGYSAKRLKEMPTFQSIALYLLLEYDREREQVARLLTLPTHQGLSRLENYGKESRKRLEKTENVLVRMHQLSIPAFAKAWHAQGRLERLVIALRAVELLRMQKSPPNRWADLRSGLIDPWTGESLESWYRLEEKQAVIHMPSPFRVTQKRFLLPLPPERPKETPERRSKSLPTPR